MPEFVSKIIQIYDCKVARHGNMIVGKTGSGKSEAWRCLQRTLGKLKAAHPDVDSFQRVHVYTINPLALSNDEMYGSFEEVGNMLARAVINRLDKSELLYLQVVTVKSTWLCGLSFTASPLLPVPAGYS